MALAALLLDLGLAAHRAGMFVTMMMARPAGGSAAARRSLAW